MPALHKFALLVIAAALLFGILLMPEKGDKQTVRPVAAPTIPETSAPKGTATATARPVKTTPPPPQPATGQAATVKANELGQVPVLMYHRIIAKPMAPLDRTPKEFRDELERLAKAGYVPVTAAEFVQGKIDIPAGAHPVVLTFDDGYPSHFALDAEGKPAKDTVIAILAEIAAKYPSFRQVATFYILKDPFQLADEAETGLKWLVSHGFEIGNHTFDHADLSKLGEKGVQEQISKDEAQIQKFAGTPSVTMAYPYGALPKKREWAVQGPTWKFQGIFLAGWRPAESPFSKAFDPLEIPRIRVEDKIKTDGCDQFCSRAWLEWLDKNPDKRYTSDGDASAISGPAAVMKNIDPQFAAQARIY